MTTEKKITDKELRQEIQKGKTEKQIAHDNGYGYPSGRLNQRIRELGFEKNQKLTLQSSGGATFYLPSSTMQDLAVKNSVSLDKDSNLFFRKELKSDGRIVLEVTEKSFKQVDKE